MSKLILVLAVIIYPLPALSALNSYDVPDPDGAFVVERTYKIEILKEVCRLKWRGFGKGIKNGKNYGKNGQQIGTDQQSCGCRINFEEHDLYGYLPDYTHGFLNFKNPLNKRSTTFFLNPYFLEIDGVYPLHPTKGRDQYACRSSKRFRSDLEKVFIDVQKTKQHVLYFLRPRDYSLINSIYFTEKVVSNDPNYNGPYAKNRPKYTSTFLDLKTGNELADACKNGGFGNLNRMYGIECRIPVKLAKHPFYSGYHRGIQRKMHITLSNGDAFRASISFIVLSRSPYLSIRDTMINGNWINDLADLQVLLKEIGKQYLSDPWAIEKHIP